MPEHLLPEIIDSIIDLSRDNPEVLRNCSLVSKSWVARTQKYLFEEIEFRNSSDLEKWKTTFPDPERSLAYLARYLLVSCPRDVTAEDREEGGWILSFTNIKGLEVRDRPDEKARSWSEHSFTPFHGFSQTLENLRVDFDSAKLSEVLALACSFPSLKDLDISVSSLDDDIDKVGAVFTSSPEFDGTLVLNCQPSHVAHRLSGLPGGLRFREIKWNSCYQKERKSEGFQVLVDRCFGTLEIMNIDFGRYAPRMPSLDLSKTTKLKGVIVLSEIISTAGWIAGMLNTIGSAHKDLRAVLIRVCLPSSISDVEIDWAVVAGTYRPLINLDETLVRLSEPHAARRKIACCIIGMERKPEEARKWVEHLFPGMAKKGLICIMSDFEAPLFLEQAFGCDSGD